MRKKHFLLGLAFLLSAPVVFAQNTTAPGTTTVNTEGVVMLSPYDPGSPSFVTDITGNFVFTRFDSRGNPSAVLWKYDPAGAHWENASSTTGTQGKLTRIAGATNISVVSPGSSINAVYWKDASGTFWCLSSMNADLSDPSALVWEVKNNEALQTKDQQGNAVWENKLSVRLYYTK